MRRNTREKIYQFVCECIMRGLPPTVREVQERFGFKSVGTAREHLDRLVSEGRLLKVRGSARGFRLPETMRRGGPSFAVPILGRVQAGQPTLAIQDIEGTVWVDGGADEELFALRVKGDSMKDAGILEGDIVIVRRQADAAHGDIVVVLLDNEATVKRLKRSGGSVWLYPANPAYAPIRLIAEDVHILGKVVELRRYMR